MRQLSVRCVDHRIDSFLHISGHCKGSTDTLFKYKEECESGCGVSGSSGRSTTRRPAPPPRDVTDALSNNDLQSTASFGPNNFRIVDKQGGGDQTVTIIERGQGELNNGIRAELSNNTATTEKQAETTQTFTNATTNGPSTGRFSGASQGCLS